ncbi:MAG: EAL domain-containing protein [Sulfurimonadaceae bacterium]
MNMNLKSKLLFLSIVPVLLIFIFSFILLYEIFNDKKNLEQTKHHILEASAISGVIHFMQIERGVTSGFIAGRSINDKYNALILARADLDRAIDNAKSTMAPHLNKGNAAFIINLLDKFKSDRRNIDLLKIEMEDAKNFYTKNIDTLLNLIKAIPSMMEDKENRNYIEAYSYLSSLKESLGQIRALMMEVFTRNKFSDEAFIVVKENLKVCEIDKKSFKIVAPKDILDFYNNRFRGESVEEMIRMIDISISNRNGNDFGIEPSYWFKKSTESINLLNDTENELFKHVAKLINKKLDLIFYKITALVTFLLFAIIALAILMTIIVKKILSSTNKLEEKYSDSLLLLEQYKSTVDRNFIVSKTNPKGVITYANDEFCRISGYTKEELLGKPHNIIRHSDMPRKAFKAMWYTIKDLKQPWFGEIKNCKKDGSYYWVKVIVNPIVDYDGNIVEYIAIRSDITEIKDALTTDSLTGYENRFKLNSDLGELENTSIAIFNIDNFRQINDFYGHKFGDLVIISVANKIYSLVCKNNNFRFYRLQGDEFAVLGLNYSEDIFKEEMKNLLNTIKEKFSMKNEEILLSWSCGISFQNRENILSTANMALKMAKNSNLDFVIYSHEMSLNEQYENNMIMTKKISNAKKEEKIIAYYQPIVNNSNLAYEKYECLVRMIDEDKVLSPFFFLDIAKQTKQYFKLTESVISHAFKMFADKDAEFSINLSVKDILEPEISRYIFMMLDRYNIGSRVVFEIVESEYIENFEGVINFISEVKKYNCKIAIDDFGTGYSNFEYLIKLQADYLKIDGSLIKNIDKDNNSHLVVSTIVEFAKKLGMKTIAEFVENETIFNIVKEMEIDYSQGYYFSAPKETI